MIDFSKYKIITPTHEQIKEWCLKIHYAKRIPQVLYKYGLLHNKELIAIITYGYPASNFVREAVCGKKYSHLVIELNRLITKNKLITNLTSWFVAQTINLFPKPTIILSYADANQNHIGTIYQATNFYFTGMGGSETELLVNGKAHVKRHAYLYKNQDVIKIHKKLKYRYLYILGDKRQKKELLKALRWEILPYPKGESQRYEINYEPSENESLF